MFEKIIDVCLGLLSVPAQAVKINRVWFDRNRVYKRRKWWAWVPTLVGNPVLACRQVPVCVLSTSQWILWEREVKRVLGGGGENMSSGRVLICDQLSGIPLSDWLIKSGETKDARLVALRTALEGLQAFHRHQIDDGRGNCIPLSHGDATVNNVLYNAADHGVQWIDFDLRHWLHVRAPQRHADDLRAFLFSAARHLAEEELSELVSRSQAQYDERAVWDCLKDQVGSRWFRFDVFHRAQIRRGGCADTTENLALKHTRLVDLISRTRT